MAGVRDQDLRVERVDGHGERAADVVLRDKKVVEDRLHARAGGGSESTVGTRVGATVGRGGGRGPSAPTQQRRGAVGAGGRGGKAGAWRLSAILASMM